MLAAAEVVQALVYGARASGPTGLGVPDFMAQFVKVPVANDPRARVAAEHVHGWLDFATADGEAIAGRVRAGWAHTEQAPDRSPFATDDDPGLNEAEIPAGITRHLDVATYADEFGGFRMWTNASMQMLASPNYTLGDREIVARLTVRGSNAAEQSLTMRLTREQPGGVKVTVVPGARALRTTLGSGRD